MADRRPVYVAGPYGASTPTEIEVNVQRATAVGRLAVHRGRAPLVPHLLGAAGLYGAPDESDPEVRPRALRCSRALARVVGEVHGLLWVIERGDGSLSEGTEIEVDFFVRGVLDWGGSRLTAQERITRARWDVWSRWLSAEGVRW